MNIRVIILTLCSGFFYSCATGDTHAGTSLTETEDFAASTQARDQGTASTDDPEGLEIELREVRYRVHADRRMDVHRTMVMRYETEEAVRYWGRIDVNYEPWLHQAPVISATVTTPSGRTFVLDPTTLSEASTGEQAPNVFSDTRRIVGPLPGLVPGAIAEIHIDLIAKRPLFATGQVVNYDLTEHFPTRKSVVIIEAAPEIPLRYAFMGTKLLAAEQRDGQWHRISVVMEPPPKRIRIEPYQPDDAPWSPTLVFSTGDSWNSVAKSYAELVDKQVSGGDLSAWIPTEATKIRDTRTKVELVRKRIRELVRYTGVEFGQSAILPVAPQEVLSRRYGDCKDMSALLVAMLRQLGLKAHLALLDDGPGPDVSSQHPGLGSFDHAIVYVEGKQTLWVDMTEDYLPAGELPLRDQDRWALIATPKTKELQKTPRATSQSNTYYEKRVFYFADYGPGRVFETTQGRGARAAALRESIKQRDDHAWKEWAQQYIKTTYNAEHLRSLDVKKTDSVMDPFEVSMQISGARRVFTYEENADVWIQSGPLRMWLPEMLTTAVDKKEEDSLADRKRDVQLLMPLVTEYEYELHVPPGFVVEQTPKDLDLRAGVAQFERRISSEPNGIVRIRLKVDTGHGRFTSTEALLFRQHAIEILKDNGFQLKLVHAAKQALDAGQMREGFDLLRTDIRDNSDAVMPRVRFALALLRAGFGQAARQEAEIAVTKAPDRAVVYETLGWVLAHDVNGRFIEEGFDRNKALAAFDKAQSLTPTEPWVQRQRSLLLLHGPDGVALHTAEQLEPAIIALQRLQKIHGDHSLDEQLLRSLLHAERYDELERTATEMDESALRSSMLLLCHALKDVNSVRERVRKLTSNDDEQTRLLMQTAGGLMLARHYRKAETVFAEVLKGRPESVELLPFIRRLKKMQRIEQWTPKQEPSLPFKQLFISLMAPELLPKKFSNDMVFASSSLAEDPKNEEVQNASQQLRRFSLGAQTPPRTLAEMFLALSTFHWEGNDRSGYRVKMQMSGSAGNLAQTSYVVRENGSYKIRFIGRSLAKTGTESLACLARGDVEGAAQWLEWLRDDLPKFNYDDAFRDLPFERLWSQEFKKDRSKIETAAAALLIYEDSSTVKAMQILKRALKAEKDPVRGAAIEHAIVGALGKQKKFSERLTLIDSLLVRFPTSKGLLSLKYSTLGELKDHQAQLVLAQQLQAQGDDDEFATVWISESLFHLAKYRQAHQTLHSLITRKKASLSVYNNYAWYGLFDNPMPADAIESIEQACQQNKYSNIVELNTLAALYAEDGLGNEASKVARKAMEIDAEEMNKPHWRYVSARIAEDFGLIDIAARIYTSLEKSEETVDDDIVELVKRRRQVMNQ